MTLRMKRGFQYELQTRNHIAIQSDTQQAWLWKHTPEKELESAGIIWDYDEQRIKRRKQWDTREQLMPDTGVDIFVKKDNGYMLVQCKNFSDRPVYPADLATFYQWQLEHDLPGEVYSNSPFHVSITSRSFKKIRFVRFSYIAASSESIENRSERHLILHDYQIDAFNKIMQTFGSVNRITLSLACGLGKTVIAANVAKNFHHIVIMSPLRVHADQNLRRFLDIIPNCKGELVDSDGNRDAKHLTSACRSAQPLIISATFKSSDVISDILDDLAESCFIFIDEFHNLTLSDIIDPKNSMNKILTSARKILFSSATPRVFSAENTDYDGLAEDMFGELSISIPLSQVRYNLQAPWSFVSSF